MYFKANIIGLFLETVVQTKPPHEYAKPTFLIFTVYYHTKAKGELRLSVILGKVIMGWAHQIMDSGLAIKSIAFLAADRSSICVQMLIFVCLLLEVKLKKAC